MHPLVDDSEATAELPQLDMRALSAVFERLQEAERAPLDSKADWQRQDEFAGLRDRIIHLEAQLKESNAQYARLTVRHEALQQVLIERDGLVAELQEELRQGKHQLSKVREEQSIECVALRQRVTELDQQRQQRDQFIVKQAQEIRRLRAVPGG